MNADGLKEILAQHKQWISSNGRYGRRANLRGADLSDEDLRDANLQDADLRRADLRCAVLQDANLRGADLRGADLRGADLRGANLSDADLRGADLQYAKLQGADLRGADIDYSSWPLWCGSLDVKIDARIAAQLMYHTLRAMRSCALDDDVAEVLRNSAVIRLANRFHRVKECGMIKGGAA